MSKYKDIDYNELAIEVNKFSRTKDFIRLREMLNSSDPNTVKLAIGIIDSRYNYPNLVLELNIFIDIENGNGDNINTYNIFNYVGSNLNKANRDWSFEPIYEKLKLRGV